MAWGNKTKIGIFKLIKPIPTSSHTAMLYLIPHPKFPKSSDLCIWHVHFWLHDCQVLLVASTVDHWVWTSLILPLDLLDLHPQVILSRPGHCLSVSVHDARDTAAHGSSWWCQIHHHWPVLVPPLPNWHCHCLRSQITTIMQAELAKTSSCHLFTTPLRNSHYLTYTFSRS